MIVFYHSMRIVFFFSLLRSKAFNIKVYNCYLSWWRINPLFNVLLYRALTPGYSDWLTAGQFGWLPWQQCNVARLFAAIAHMTPQTHNKLQQCLFVGRLRPGESKSITIKSKWHACNKETYDGFSLLKSYWKWVCVIQYACKKVLFEEYMARHIPWTRFFCSVSECSWDIVCDALIDRRACVRFRSQKSFLFSACSLAS